MDKKTEALKLALEYRDSMSIEVLHSWADDMKRAAQEALAEQPAQKQEPVAWRAWNTSFAHAIEAKLKEKNT